MNTKPVLSKDDALLMLRAAEAEALRNHWAVSIAVCDDGGHLVAFVRLPGASPASAAISQAKARTAALMGRDTKAVEDMINQGRNAFLSAPGLDGMLEGGMPVIVNGQCAGAMGISGVQKQQDAQIAQAGIAAVTGA
ncbi:MAG TPA: heme-binding protein [Burkholderiaceae bacterium]|nr:heme-binding protein [Burkholderiaceae bacterium]